MVGTCRVVVLPTVHDTRSGVWIRGLGCARPLKPRLDGSSVGCQFRPKRFGESLVVAEEVQLRQRVARASPPGGSGKES
jgi:hypothetical protein